MCQLLAVPGRWLAYRRSPTLVNHSWNDNEPQTTDHIYELHCAVRDISIGIPPEQMDRLFKSFSQVDTSTTRKYGGTRLGLAISQRLSQMMGGTMWVESEVRVPLPKPLTPCGAGWKDWVLAWPARK